jgi:hypothetical protein
VPLVEQAHFLLGEPVVRQQRDEAPIAQRLGREERRKLGDGVSRDRPLAQMEIVVHGEDGRRFDLSLAEAPGPMRVRVADPDRSGEREQRMGSRGVLTAPARMVYDRDVLCRG